MISDSSRDSTLESEITTLSRIIIESKTDANQ